MNVEQNKSIRELTYTQQGMLARMVTNKLKVYKATMAMNVSIAQLALVVAKQIGSSIDTKLTKAVIPVFEKFRAGNNIKLDNAQLALILSEVVENGRKRVHDSKISSRSKQRQRNITHGRISRKHKVGICAFA